MLNTICQSGLIGRRNRISERRRGAASWPFSHGLLFIILLVASPMYLSGCGSEQTDVGQINGNSVPVNLNISMPQESAAASTSGSSFWATVQSWLPSVTNAWAVTSADLRTLTVVVTTEDLQSLTTKTVDIPQPARPEQVILVDLDVPVGPNRIFVVSGFDATRARIFQGQSNPVTLTAGQAASVDVILIDITTGTVTGTVTNVGTGATLSNATVAVNGTSIRTTTNSDGNFTLSGVTPGPRTLAISASGFTSTTRAVTVVAGASVSAGTIALVPTNAALKIDTDSLPDGCVGELYSQQLSASGGTPPYTWLVTDNPNQPVDPLHPRLPPKLQLSREGLISGIPDTLPSDDTDKPGSDKTGSFTGLYHVTDMNGKGATIAKLLTLSIKAQGVMGCPSTGTVTGAVTNEGTGGGFLNATVAVNGTKLSTFTLDNGVFILNDVPQGLQTLRISATGYAPKTKTVTVVGGSSVSAGTITLNPAELANIIVTSYDPSVNLCFHPGFQTYKLSPSFNPEQSTYTVLLPSSTFVCIVMTRASLEQTVTIDGKSTLPPKGDPFPFNLYPIVRSGLPQGLVFTIVVTAPGGVTQKTYTIDPM
jgi:hypothetical protein